jgi:diketogulonate reductase-like aldo/keto reductase
MTISRRHFLAGTGSVLAASGQLQAQQHVPTGSMLTKIIPATGEEMPIIGLGTLEAFDVEETAADRAGLGEVLNALVAHGGTLVDTSPRYGNAESVIGDLVSAQNLGDKLFFATKVFSEGEQEGRDEMNASFELLNIDQIDLMQVHSMRDWQHHLPSIRRLKEAGRVRMIGITIHRDPGHAQMMDLMRTENLDFIQINYNLIERNAALEVLPLAQELGVAVMVNVPFAKAELFNLTAGMDLPDWAASFDCHSWAQFFLKYIVSHPAVTCVIPRTSKPHHMLDNLMAGFGRMPDMEMRKDMENLIDSLG